VIKILTLLGAGVWGYKFNPLGYLDMMMLEKNARLIVADSGGIQRESFFHKVPCVTLRDEIEWVELVDAGMNVLAGADKGKTM